MNELAVARTVHRITATADAATVTLLAVLKTVSSGRVPPATVPRTVTVLTLSRRPAPHWLGRFSVGHEVVFPERLSVFDRIENGMCRVLFWVDGDREIARVDPSEHLDDRNVLLVERLYRDSLSDAGRRLRERVQVIDPGLRKHTVCAQFAEEVCLLVDSLSCDRRIAVVTDEFLSLRLARGRP
ncbi:hypothetical protein [Halobaculum sp. MBLA0143]|uniref:hypothetical protein n=1 Tax=Halobaculum sp. MBLA0143 TaxID=3079933 RepID=UPI003524DAC9